MGSRSNYENASAEWINATDGGTNWWRELVHTPDWKLLWEQLRWAWQLHVYGIACFFLVLGVASFFTILGLRAQLSARPHLSSLNVFLCLLSTARTVALFIDPYGSRKTMPLVMSNILWDLGYPCLLSAFALLQLSFLRMTQVKMTPSRLSNETTVSVIITSHFCLIIASDILWALQNSLRIVWLLTQVLFVVWGLFLCLTFLCGCLRLLRSIVKLPLRFLSQIDPGYEIKGILPLGIFTSAELPPRLANNAASTPASAAAAAAAPPLGPKIRITDVNDQTFSYASDASQAALPTPDRRSVEGIPHRHITIPESPKQWHNRAGISQMNEDPAVIRPLMSRLSQMNEDPAVIRPLMEDRDRNHMNSVPEDGAEQGMIIPELQSGAATISALQKGGSFVQHSLRISPNFMGANDDFKFDARKLKTKRRSRLEKLLRRLVLTSFFGILLCLLKAYDVFGPHGLSSGRRNAAVVPWFIYQTISRLVEFAMGCSMASITRQSLHSHCYHYCSGGSKHRDALFT